MKIIGCDSVGQGGGYCADGQDRFVKGSSDKGEPVKRVDSTAQKMHQNPVYVNTLSKDIKAFSITPAQRTVPHDGVKETCMKRMRAMKPVIDKFIEEFKKNKEYEELKHKFKTPREKSCLLDAIATTLFGKEASTEACKFTNSLRDDLEKNNIVSRNDMLDTGNNRLKEKIHQYVMEYYGVDIELVVLEDYQNLGFRMVNSGNPLGKDTYKVPVLFDCGGDYQTFYGISLEAPIREKPPVPKKPEGLEEKYRTYRTYRKAMERKPDGPEKV